MKFSKRSLDNLVGVEPRLVRIITEAIKESPFDFTITEGLRTAARQKELYAQGRTVKGIKVTNRDGVRNKSNHQAKADGFGHAIDIYPYYNGDVQIHDKEVIPRLKAIANHVKKITAKLEAERKTKNPNAKPFTITWGGDWKNPYDPPHFEL